MRERQREAAEALRVRRDLNVLCLVLVPTIQLEAEYWRELAKQGAWDSPHNRELMWGAWVANSRLRKGLEVRFEGARHAR